MNLYSNSFKDFKTEKEKIQQNKKKMDGLASPEFPSAQGRGLAGWPPGLGPTRPGTPSSSLQKKRKRTEEGERGGDRRRGTADSDE